jgi:hypothetical protein
MTDQDRPQLQRIIATAVFDEAFCDLLLNGDRRQAIEAFDLSLDEQDAVLAIEADDLETFARQLLRRTKQHECRTTQRGPSTRVRARDARPGDVSLPPVSPERRGGLGGPPGSP